MRIPTPVAPCIEPALIMRAVLLTLMLLLATPARADDALTPRFKLIEQLARQAKWTAVLDALAEFGSDTSPDYRYFYWRAVAFYYRGWREAGDEEARTAKKFLASAQLPPATQKLVQRNLAAARRKSWEIQKEKLRASCETEFSEILEEFKCGGIRVAVGAWAGQIEEKPTEKSVTLEMKEPLGTQPNPGKDPQHGEDGVNLQCRPEP